jgi:hypothetical protein
MTNLYHLREDLKNKGMTLLSTRPDSDEPAREYWGFKDKPNTHFDHSATLTHVGKDEWVLSDFDASTGKWEVRL